jgi:twinkle protein
MIYPKKDFDLETVLEKTKYLIRAKGIRALIIDPYNTIEHKMKAGEREDLYISRFMSELKRFSIDNDISIQLIAHQVTPTKDSNGKYIRPDVNKIKGGGTFADKADNVLYVWRPERALDFSSTSVVFGSQKIKKQKLVGIPQDIVNIDFKRKTNRYYINGVSPFDTVDETRTGVLKSKII